MKVLSLLTCFGILSLLTFSAVAQTLKPASDNLYKYEEANSAQSRDITIDKADRFGHQQPPPKDPMKVPFDGGLSIFAAAAAGLAIRRKYKQKTK